MKRLIILTTAFLLLQACVPMKKLIYLQDDNSTIRKQDTTEYRFKQKDLIYLRIKTRDAALNELFNPPGNTPNLSSGNIYFMSYIVGNQGFIDVPVIGKVRAEGKTAEEIKEEITRILLAQYFKNPQDVFVEVKPAGMIITVIGEVHSPGTLNILKENPNILEAIAQAGDINLTGNRTDIMVIRENADGTKEIGHIDLTKRDALNSPYYYLQNNDLIYIKPLPQKTIGTGTTFVNTLSTVMGITSFLISIYLLTRR